MKILVICQYYYPEPFRISDICESLVRRGHDVTVVTGVPNYPEGVTYPGYEKGKKRDEVICGVKVHRCFTVSRKTGAVRRLLNYYSYVFSSGRYIRTLPGDYDVVFVNQLSPVMMAQAGIIYSLRHRKPLLMYCLDLWPESLIAGGISQDSPIYRFFYQVSKRIYTQMDAILITSRMFARHLEEQFGIDCGKIRYLPQYAESLFDISPEALEKEGIDLMFAGNIGEIQSVETILEAARQLKEEPVTFHIVGGGSDLERLRALAAEWQLDRVVFYGRRPLDEMPDFYRKADAMLVTLKADPVLSLTLPGKVQSYMAAGKPIIGAINGETPRVIAEADCGFCADAEDAEALARSILLFANSDRKKQMAENARKYYEEQFAKERFLDTLERELLSP